MSFLRRGAAATAAATAATAAATAATAKPADDEKKLDDKKLRVMTVEEIKAELEGDSEVSNGMKKLSLSEYPDVLDILSVHSSEWPSTIEALEKAGVKNIDDLMITARRLYLGYANTEKKLTDALLDDLIIDKLRTFGARVSVEKSTPGVKFPAAANTTTTPSQGGEQANRAFHLERLHNRPSSRLTHPCPCSSRHAASYGAHPARTSLCVVALTPNQTTRSSRIRVPESVKRLTHALGS